jgi:hypothetical protein
MSMFGRAHDTDTIDHDESGDTSFFGDEAAAAEAVEVNELRDRVEQAESQIASQFTSLATYAQIAQEQVELARSEARAATERSEQRLTSLIERERADRIAGVGHIPGDRGVAERLDDLEDAVAEIRHGLDECLARQKALADAITMMFDRLASTGPSELPADVPTDDLAAPEVDDEVVMASADDSVADADADKELDETNVITERPTVEPSGPGEPLAPPLPAPTPFAPPSATTPVAGPIADLSLG